MGLISHLADRPHPQPHPPHAYQLVLVADRPDSMFEFPCEQLLQRLVALQVLHHGLV